MIRTVEAVIDEHGNVRLLEPIHLQAARWALVTILEERPVSGVPESALLSEAVLAEDWNKPEEDEAWRTCSRCGSSRSFPVLGPITGEVTPNHTPLPADPR